MILLSASSSMLPAQYPLGQLPERRYQLKDAGCWPDNADGRNHDAMMIRAVNHADQSVSHILDLSDAVCIELGNASVIHRIHGTSPTNYIQWSVDDDATGNVPQLKKRNDRNYFYAALRRCAELKRLPKIYGCAS